ncbi:hypothetical protein [Iningainema tapete]|uniref:Uncharacterized protein n=1 Tax=Iningainema tapete BLCC-T55 TaxID=2748662 RepID=A0A8J6XQZ0_9CYAN|nr:hypothetical protein [Iningainema tapete]MBD2776695.1 hypothetical protein [Iningainema tapete BLCC-T55]
MSYEQNKVEYKNDSYQVQPTEGVPERSPLPNHVITTDIFISLIPLGFILIWAGSFLLLSKMRTLALDKIASTTNTLHKVPCKNCQYFSNNRYLKCAIQPSIVLTEQAKDCSDYCPKTNKSE